VGVWEKILLKVLNKGNANAKNIKIEFKRAEFEGLVLIKSLGVREKKDLTVDFKSKDAGSVPLKIDIRFEDFEGKRYEEPKTLHINVGEVKEKGYEIPTEKEIEIKRGYEVLQNNDNIHPNGERTVTYILTPLGCIHNERIDATVIYKDHTGEKQTVQMRPKEVHCVCPFLKEKAMREGEFSELANTCESIEEGLSFSGIGVNEIAEFIKEACAHRLFVSGEHEVDATKILYLSSESIGEKAYYLLTAIIQPYKNLTQVALRAYSDKPYGLHGVRGEVGVNRINQKNFL